MQPEKPPLIKRFLRRQSLYMGYLMAMTRDLDAAEEIFQNVAVALMEQAGEAEIRDLDAWLKEVVRRQALRYLNSRSRQTSRVRATEPSLLEGISRAFEEDVTPEERVRSERRALESCIGDLGEKPRRMFHLRYRERRSFADIAVAMRSSGIAVQRALSRIRKLLHDCIRMKITPVEG